MHAQAARIKSAEKLAACVESARSDKENEPGTYAQAAAKQPQQRPLQASPAKTKKS